MNNDTELTGEYIVVYGEYNMFVITDEEEKKWSCVPMKGVNVTFGIIGWFLLRKMEQSPPHTLTAPSNHITFIIQNYVSDVKSI
jgi:hypothetical protein